MKKDRYITKNALSLGAIMRSGLYAGLGLALASGAFAKKGGGKPGGEDPPPDPKPTPAPVSYVLTWLEGDNDDWSRFHDVDADGVAVGFFGPGVLPTATES